MSSIVITPRDRKILAWIALLIGVLLTAGGLVGVWLQGLVYERGFPTPATVNEIRMAFTLPTAVTTSGSLIVAAVLLASPLTAAWTPTRRVSAVIGFTVLVLLACTVCGHLAGSRVVKILN
jgi:hypothetical protein